MRILFRPFRAKGITSPPTQGVALGWHVSAFQAEAITSAVRLLSIVPVAGRFSQYNLRHRRFLHEPINPLAVERAAQQVNLAFFVFAEGEHRFAAVLDRPIGDDAALRLVVTQGPELGGDVIAVDVVALQFAQAVAAVDVAADDALAYVVVVFPDRFEEVLARPVPRAPKGCRPSRRFQP